MCVRGYMCVRGCMCVRARLSSICLFLVSLQKPPYVHLTQIKNQIKTQIKTRWKEKNPWVFLNLTSSVSSCLHTCILPGILKKKPKEIRGVANEQEHAAGERIWREDCV